MKIIQIIITKVNCGLLGDSHKRSPYQRFHIEILNFVFWLALELLSQVRAAFFEVWNANTRYAEIARPLRVVLVVDIEIFSGKLPWHVLENSDPGSCLQQRVSSQVRSSLHLLATLENLALRHFDLNLQRLVSQHIVLWDANHVDWVLWVSLGDWMHSSSALLESLPQNARPRST